MTSTTSASNDVAHKPALDFLRYLGPGMIVAVGFIDPGNWAANLAAGAQFGYKLLWAVALATLVLTVLQHNAARLGIITGKCLSENATAHLNKYLSRFILGTAMLAAISTSLAFNLGSALALQMLFHLPLQVGAVLSGGLTVWLLFSNSYRRIEKIIMGFIALIGLSFLVELWLSPVDWGGVGTGLAVPSLPSGSVLIVLSIIGSVVMPHNLFLHSEVIQSRQWNLENDEVIKKQLKYELTDTVFSMVVGWVINSAMIVLAAALFFTKGVAVTELAQAQELLRPLLGNAAAVIFALALLLAGIASSLTAGMAGGSILAGMFGEPYDTKHPHSKAGVLVTIVLGVAIVFLVHNPFDALVYSQVALAAQLIITIALVIYLTASTKVMGRFRNTRLTNVILVVIAVFVAALNVLLLVAP